jgi:hypothetical protein
MERFVDAHQIGRSLNNSRFGAVKFVRSSGGAILFAMAVLVVMAVIAMKFVSIGRILFIAGAPLLSLNKNPPAASVPSRATSIYPPRQPRASLVLRSFVAATAELTSIADAGEAAAIDGSAASTPRQVIPNNRPPRRAAVITATGHEPTSTRHERQSNLFESYLREGQKSPG